jgi:limonene-1,2-epoxide hydrolase
MAGPETNRQAVLDFFKAWEKGSLGDIVEAYRHYLADDVLYENPGVPPCLNIDESIAFIESACEIPALEIQTIKVDLKHIAAVGNLVFTERIDWHYNSQGEATLVPAICGIMEFNDAGKIRRWADYFDPGPMLAALS